LERSADRAYGHHCCDGYCETILKMTPPRHCD
jgi:hypothetical protein